MLQLLLDEMVKMLMKKKSQAAMEYLTTYGWAVLAIVIALSAIAYFVGSPSSQMPELCMFNAGFFCRDMAIRDNTTEMSIVNNVGLIELQNITFRERCQNNVASVNGMDFPVRITDGETFNLKIECQDFPKGRFTETASITYKAIETGLEHTISGEIKGNAK